MDFQKILEEIVEELAPYRGQGRVADYIPALAEVDEDDFAMTVMLLDGSSYSVGSVDKKFSIQSISKVYTFAQALHIYRSQLYERVGKEPSGNPFNSLVQLEHENGIPRNPFINAGAIVITDSLIAHYKEAGSTFSHILEFIQKSANNWQIGYNAKVWNSEIEHGYRNAALANLMKSFGNLEGSVDEVLTTYFRHCSIEMSSNELARSMLFLANHGTDPLSQKAFLTAPQAKRVNAVMLTCGHYDASGDFAFHVGLPAKSGVGGGIVAIVPNKMAIAVYSPRLNSWGNSLLGTKALELFTAKTGLSIF